MKSYYTVELVGADLPGGARIAAEAAFVRTLELHLGGDEGARSVCASAASGDTAAGARLAEARKLATAAAAVPGGRFTLRVWQAQDL